MKGLTIVSHTLDHGQQIMSNIEKPEDLEFPLCFDALACQMIDNVQTRCRFRSAQYMPKERALHITYIVDHTQEG